VGSRQYQRCGFVRFAESVRDEDLGVLDSRALDRVDLYSFLEDGVESTSCPWMPEGQPSLRVRRGGPGCRMAAANFTLEICRVFSLNLSGRMSGFLGYPTNNDPAQSITYDAIVGFVGFLKE
jgi:hypothetical protein